jgi:hypothetical protein
VSLLYKAEAAMATGSSWSLAALAEVLISSVPAEVFVEVVFGMLMTPQMRLAELVRIPARCRL